MPRNNVYVMDIRKLKRLQGEGRSHCYICGEPFKVGDRIKGRTGRHRNRNHEACVEASRI